MSLFGTTVRGVRAPIIKQGDNLVKIVADSVINASLENNVILHDKDVVAVTEAVLARSQGNYATTAQIAEDVKSKFTCDNVGLILPILSRNRFSLLLKGISQGVKHLTIQLSVPQDEVGNPLIDPDIYYEKVSDLNACFTEDEFRQLFGNPVHPFTGMDYIKFYKEVCQNNCTIILSNNPCEILKHTKQVINADIHTRRRTKKLLLDNGAEKVYSLTDILSSPINGSGYNEEYGLLGSNLATDDKVKLFPRNSQKFAEDLQREFFERTGKTIECMIYGDGAFKDPVGKIWELADPVVSPGFTKGLIGKPNEIKLKYFADNDIKDLSGIEAQNAMKTLIRNKKSDMVASKESLGTTPRNLTDLIGSLCDLTSGSGDKGTPIVLISGYFDNYATEN